MTVIKTGDIIHLTNYPVPHRETKWVVVVAETEKWCFCINSENREMYNCVVIEKTIHTFLKNDKHYIACKNTIRYEECNITKKYGSLTKNELINLRNHVENVRTIKPHDKEIIIASLQNEIDGL